ncbi:MAG: aromatic amino acid hydroxylase, partial [Proteobacteria bacterium]
MLQTSPIPEYLRPFIATQNADLYSAMDHAAWRFILKISRTFFKGAAHQKYLDGLAETGISPERIPLIEDMDRCLSRFGWRAVAVNGFIPPAVFMEFQSLGILPIACEMRTLDHLAYTPAPDIVHEAAGHAPIIADPEYASYLRQYGEVSRKAIFSSEDYDLFEAIRTLSIVKEDPASSPEQIERAEKDLEKASNAISYISEAAELARMNWWTVEYGLIGSVEDPKIYGAGLLSSVGESYHCLSPHVIKHPLTLECIKASYDITRPQPQLFVTESFQKLTDLVLEYAETMAFKRGGEQAVAKALQAKSVTTVVLDTGLQVSGVLTEAPFKDSALQFFKFSGPVQLSYQDHELPDQGPENHAQGFSSPLGLLRNGQKLSALSDEEIHALNGKLSYESGYDLQGTLRSITRQDGKLLLLTFEKCTVTHHGKMVYDPAWGRFDLAVGEQAVSVFGGAADRRVYLEKTGGLKPLRLTPKTN